MSKLTLPTDSADRKNYPMFSGVLRYFPAALAGIAKISKLGNDKHNPGQPMHHARGKSTDHGDCIIRHLTDTEDLLASIARKEEGVTPEMALVEASQLAWRALAYAQELHEKFGAPLAPGAKLETDKLTTNRVLTVADFKVRMKVRITSKTPKTVADWSFAPSMVSELGLTGIVTEINDEGSIVVDTGAEARRTNWCWKPEHLEIL